MDYFENLQKMSNLYDKACSGDPNSQFLWGTMCRNMGKNEDSVKWLEKAGKQRQTNAQYDLGLMYARGIGARQNFTVATQWFRKAAEQGHSGAQYMLAICYIEGLGVPKDLLEAVGWLKKSATQGNQDAIAQLKELF